MSKPNVTLLLKMIIVPIELWIQNDLSNPYKIYEINVSLAIYMLKRIYSAKNLQFHILEMYKVFVNKSCIATKIFDSDSNFTKF